MKEQRLSERLFGKPTAAKSSGLSFSLAAILPTAFSFVFLLVLAIIFGEDQGYTGADWYLYCNYLLPQLSFAVVAIIFLRYIRVSPMQAVKSQKCSVKYYIVALILQVGLWSLAELNNVFLRFLQRFGYKDAGIALPSMDGVGFVFVLLAVALLPAVFEELFFRGVLLYGLKSFSKTAAVLLCGALFAIYHQNPVQTIYQFCCGAAFALVAIHAGSILPTVLSHFINNAVILVLTKFGVAEFPTPVFWTVVSVSALCFIGALGYLLFIDKRKNEHTPNKEEQKRFFLFSAVGIFACVFTWLLVLLVGM